MLPDDPLVVLKTFMGELRSCEEKCSRCSDENRLNIEYLFFPENIVFFHLLKFSMINSIQL